MNDKTRSLWNLGKEIYSRNQVCMSILFSFRFSSNLSILISYCWDHYEGSPRLWEDYGWHGIGSQRGWNHQGKATSIRLERLLRSEGQMKTWFYRRLYKEIPAILIVSEGCWFPGLYRYYYWRDSLGSKYLTQSTNCIYEGALRSATEESGQYI